ncbi:MAG: agmatinase [Candidatus Hydrothermarchaeales archaeon]
MPGLFASPFTFARRELSLKDARYAVLGIPYDGSESYRPGSRFAPNAIREASREIEDYDMQEEFDLRKLGISDCGDVDVSFGNYQETSRRVRVSIEGILEQDAVPICLGGEHTISHAVVGAYPEKPFFLVFDAHLDFRKEYLDERFSHACLIRRIGELIGYENILAIGVRSAAEEELKDAEKLGLKFIDFRGCEDIPRLIGLIADEIRGRDVYMSLDMDVFDPREAAGVCNPEPGGFSYWDFVTCMDFLKKAKIVGFDIVEVTPLYDSYTPVLVAKLIFKILTKMEMASGE